MRKKQNMNGMKKVWKRISAIILTASMICGSVGTVWADEGKEVPEIPKVPVVESVKGEEQHEEKKDDVQNVQKVQKVDEEQKRKEIEEIEEKIEQEERVQEQLKLEEKLEAERQAEERQVEKKQRSVEAREEDLSYGDFRYRVLNDGTVEIIGWEGDEDTTEVTIPESIDGREVTSIGDRVFWRCEKLKKIMLPAGLRSIGDYAFDDCSSLKEIILPAGVTRIGESVFCYCSSLKEIILPVGVTSIGDYAFYDCSSLKEIILPAGVTSIGEEAFKYCSSLEEIILPTGLTSIGDSAFKYCSSLEEIILPAGVTSIGDSAFAGCSNLEEIILPAGLASIGESAFNGCSSLKEIMLPERLTTIEKFTFYCCSNLKEIILPAGVTSIGDYAFDGCSSLKKIIIPEGVTKIGDDAFYGVSKNFQIYGVRGSYAETYAKEQNIPFVEMLSAGDSSVDEYLIEEVKKYTSTDAYRQFDYICQANWSDDVKLKMLNELFRNYGLTSVEEGTKFLSNATTHRADYLYLTTDETYCAYNFYSWLYSSRGTLARGILYADGLIFNGELKAYVDWKTYAESDFPGVKKNKQMLKDFLECKESKSKTFEYANQTADFMSNLIELNEIATTAKIEDLMDKIIECESEEKLKILQKQFVDEILKIIKENDSNSVNISIDTIAEALGKASSVVKFAGAVADDVLGMLNLSNEIAIYQKNSEFLKTIYNCPDVSFEMRFAAYSLLDEMENGYFIKIKGFVNDCMDFANDAMKVDKTVFRKIVGAGGELYFDALDTLELAVFISNIVIDMGDYVNQAAYTQGYAELSTLYSLKLKEDKENFLENQNAKNAWQFFKDYTILWDLRYQGEKQYLEMNKVKMYLFAKVKGPKYDIKEEVVKDTLNQLQKRKFEIPNQYQIPESVQYCKKAVINCPVDVNVYLANGTLIASLKDGVESDITNQYGRFAVVYQPYTKEYAKVICQSTDENLVIKATAVSEGFVDCEMAFAEDSDSNVYTFDKVKVSEGDKIQMDSNITDMIYEVYRKGETKPEITEVFQEKDLDKYVAVESISVDKSNVTMKVGESSAVQVNVFPLNATNQEIEWVSSDENIVTVQNGMLTALSEGTAEIYVRAIDSEKIQQKITVVVEAGEKIVKGDVSADGKITMKDVQMVFSYISKKMELTETQLKAADVTNDGKVTIQDVQRIFYYINGRIEAL